MIPLAELVTFAVFTTQRVLPTNALSKTIPLFTTLPAVVDGLFRKYFTFPTMAIGTRTGFSVCATTSCILHVVSKFAFP